MKTLFGLVVLSLVLAACSDRGRPGDAASGARDAAGNRVAGKTFAESACISCHGLDGKGAAPGIPHLAGQRERYLVGAINGYKQGKRYHSALRELAERMSEADVRNVAAYYSSLPPVAQAAGTEENGVSPYEAGKALAAACTGCHSEDGNSRKPGTPSLAGQQPRYLVLAIQEYLNAERKKSPMHPMLRDMNRLDKEKLALYFASQTPAKREAPAQGDPKAGEPLSAVCGGCHGAHGVSTDSATPSLAGQDHRYLVDAIKAYRSTRKRAAMRAYIGGLSEKQIADVAAFYAVQTSRVAEKGQTIVEDLAEKCRRCHTPEAGEAALNVPRINGQDRDYLIMALRAYRDDRRESSMMHKMSLPYGDTIIESLASHFSAQAPR